MPTPAGPLPLVAGLDGQEDGLRASEAYASAMADPLLAGVEPDLTRRDRLVCVVLSAASLQPPCASIHFTSMDGQLGVTLEFDPPMDPDADVGEVPITHLVAGRAVDLVAQALLDQAGSRPGAL